MNPKNIVITGLSLNLLDSTLLAFTAIKNRGQILKESRQIIPVIKGDRLNLKDYDRAVLQMPKVKAMLWQSYLPIIGLIVLIIGFLMQIIGTLTWQ